MKNPLQLRKGFLIFIATKQIKMETNLTQENEIWKDIPNYVGKYQISSLGRLKSTVNKNHRIKKSHPCKKGYHRVELADGKRGVKTSYAVHRLVAEAFIPNPENKSEVNHKDSIRHNNVLENLEWVTHSENQQHAYKFGNRCHKGDNHPQKILNSEIVKEIRSLPKKYGMGRELARKYNVSFSCMHSILNYRTWKHENK